MLARGGCRRNAATCRRGARHAAPLAVRREPDRQAVEDAEERTPPLQLVGGELEGTEAPHQRTDGDLRLHAGEVRAEAEVGAAAEREVRVLGAGDVEAL